MRVLIATLPLPGHFNPLVPVAHAMERRGHHVAFASAPGFGKRVERLGFEFLPVGVDWSSPGIAEVVQLALARNSDAFFVSRLFAEAVAPRALPGMLEVLDRWRPDVILRESSEFASLVAGEARGIPWSTMCFGHERSSEGWRQSLDGQLDPMRRTAGLPPDPEAKSINRYLNLVFAPSGYHPPDQPLLPTSHVIRPIPWEGPDDTLPDWVDDLSDGPTINGTLGTAFNRTPGLFEAMIDAVRERPWNLVLTIGRNRDPSEFEPLPENVRVSQFIPQSPLLRRCDALIAHAGFGTTMAGIGCGVPMVLIPLGADQRAHAESCRRLGVAEIVPASEASPENLRAALGSILDFAEAKERATALRDRLGDLPTVDTAVNLLEHLANSREPVVR